MNKSRTESALLQNLNEAQREAAQILRGPALIIAGPGSGKTRVITHRAAYLMEQQVKAGSILALTFTNKAAREMRERIAQLTGGDPEAPGGVTASTFHAYCAGLLRTCGERLGLSANYSIFSQADQQAAIRRCITDSGYDPQRYTPQEVETAIQRAKSSLQSPEEAIREAMDYMQEGTARIYRTYEETLARNNAVDFDGLIAQACRLLAEHPSILDDCQERHQYIMIDEFQDTNLAQYRLATLLAERYRNIMAVGDPRQSIYSWRNAGPANIKSFQRDYPEARTVRLQQNYRSTPEILEAAGELISQDGSEPPGTGLKLTTGNAPGKTVRKFRANNPEHEGRAIVREIRRLQAEEGVTPGDCAVLLRVNAQSRALEEACRRYGQSYQNAGAGPAGQSREIRDLTAYLKALHNSRDDLNLERIINSPPRGIGEKSAARIMDLARRMEAPATGALRTIAEAHRQGYLCPARLKPKAAAAATELHETLEKLAAGARSNPVSRTVQDILRETGLGRNGNRESLEEFARMAAQFDGHKPAAGLAALLERATLTARSDEAERRQDAVNVMTLHQAKGMEFQAVFIPGMEEGLLPHHRSMRNPEQLQEERRLCYVGITRAMSYLYLTWSAERRNTKGIVRSTRPSRFLGELPGMERRERGTAGAERPGRNTPKREMQPQNTPRRGDRVIHPQLGNGQITAVEPGNGRVTLLVRFQRAGDRRIDLLQPPEDCP